MRKREINLILAFLLGVGLALIGSAYLIDIKYESTCSKPNIECKVKGGVKVSQVEVNFLVSDIPVEKQINLVYFIGTLIAITVITVTYIRNNSKSKENSLKSNI